jgi:glycine cleavage system aminomethyltransferase T
MKVGDSRHGLTCNEKGQLLGSGVILKKAEGLFRTYWLVPALHFYLLTSGMDVKGEYKGDEYFFQLDGPKSLEILENATQCDLHDIKFAKHKDVEIAGTKMTVFRLGMSGALAYELHGAAEDAEKAYVKLKEVLLKYGGKLQGARNYCTVEHTPGGYPNQFQHFWYPFFTSGPEMAEFAQKAPGTMARYTGSASDNSENFFVTPYDVGWGYLVNFEKSDFVGRQALLALSQKPPKKMVTLEWDPDDVGEVFTSQFRGLDVEPYDQIEHISAVSDASQFGRIRGDYVLASGSKIGVATGKTYAFFERRIISLACIDAEYAKEGTDVAVLWGTPGAPQKEIRAKIAKFPYYDGQFRNETFDVEKIPRLEKN